MDEVLMHEIGTLMERGELGGLAWVNELVGYGDRVCVAVYAQSREAGMRTGALADALGLVDLYSAPVEVDGVYMTVTDAAATLTGPGWSALLAGTHTGDGLRFDAAVESRAALLIVGHGKGWARWAETDESLAAFLNRERRAWASHGWITIEEGVDRT